MSNPIVLAGVGKDRNKHRIPHTLKSVERECARCHCVTLHSADYMDVFLKAATAAKRSIVILCELCMRQYQTEGPTVIASVHDPAIEKEFRKHAAEQN